MGRLDFLLLRLVSLLELDQGAEVGDLVEVAEDTLEDRVQSLQHAKFLLQLRNLGHLLGDFVDPVGNLLSFLRGCLSVTQGLLSLSSLFDNLILQLLKSLFKLSNFLLGKLLIGVIG